MLHTPSPIALVQRMLSNIPFLLTSSDASKSLRSSSAGSSDPLTPFSDLYTCMEQQQQNDDKKAYFLTLDPFRIQCFHFFLPWFIPPGESSQGFLNRIWLFFPSVPLPDVVSVNWWTVYIGSTQKSPKIWPLKYTLPRTNTEYTGIRLTGAHKDKGVQ